MDILILDCDKQAAETMAELFALDGLFAQAVTSLDEALAALDARTFQVIFIDIPLHEPTTRFAAALLRARAPSASLVAISASGIWDKQTFDHHLHKPLDHRLLRWLVRPKAGE